MPITKRYSFIVIASIKYLCSTVPQSYFCFASSPKHAKREMKTFGMVVTGRYSFMIYILQKIKIVQLRRPTFVSTKVGKIIPLADKRFTTRRMRKRKCFRN